MRPVKGIWCHELDLYICGTAIRLTQGEMQIFTKLLSNPERIFSREMLYHARTGQARHKPDGNIRTINGFIKKIRQKIKVPTGFTKIIGAEYGMGYYLNRRWYEVELNKRKAGQ